MDGIQNGEGIQWPGGARIAVMLTFDFDAEFLRISRAHRKGKEAGFADISRGEYGPCEGIWRCLDSLDAQSVRGTFFVPGIVAERYEDAVREIHKRGHEIACHGYSHDSARGISKREGEAQFDLAERALHRITGKKPVGYRAPESILHPFTVPLLHERGYLYDATMKDCDWAYLHQLDGGEIPLVELPDDVLMDDFTYFYFTFADPAVRAMYMCREVFENWRAEFDGLAREGDKIFVLKLHPQMIGRASRISHLSAFISYMKQRGAWIDTCEEVAQYVLDWNKRGAK